MLFVTCGCLGVTEKNAETLHKSTTVLVHEYNNVVHAFDATLDILEANNTGSEQAIASIRLALQKSKRNVREVSHTLLNILQQSKLNAKTKQELSQVIMDSLQ